MYCKKCKTKNYDIRNGYFWDDDNRYYMECPDCGEVTREYYDIKIPEYIPKEQRKKYLEML